jgi:hypothetical protein
MLSIHVLQLIFNASLYKNKIIKLVTSLVVKVQKLVHIITMGNKDGTLLKMLIFNNGAEQSLRAACRNIH